MADLLKTDLPYGHLGQADYDPDEKTWHFERSTTATPTLHPLGSPKVIAPAAVETDNASKQRANAPPSARHPKQIRELVKRFPDLQPASSLLSPLLRVSESVEAATLHYDPLRGDLLAMGTIPSEVYHQQVRIAAFASGPTGGDLQLAQVQYQRRGWQDTKDAWIGVPVIHGEGTTWRGPGIPIQQICFARAVEHADAFLAVRLPTRTLIFRPIMRKEPVGASGGSRLDANLVFQLPIARTGGLSHVDVTFNPWYTRQLATIDHAGNWSVWELEGRHSKTGRMICSSSLTGGGSDDAKAAPDGWARIRWVSGLSLAVCTRRRLALYEIAEGAFASLPEFTLQQERPSQWFLDMAPLPSHQAYLVILSSTSLSLFRTMQRDGETTLVRAMTDIKHFRNPQDTTLRLCVFELEQDLYVLIRSSMDAVTTLHRFRIDDGELPLAFDPSHVNLNLESVASKVAGLHILGTRFGSRETLYGCLAVNLRNHGVRFVCLTLLTNDLQLSQTVHALLPDSSRRSSIMSPTYESKLGASSTRVRKEKFVIDDDEAEADETESERRPAISSSVRRRRLQPNDRRGMQETVTYESAAAELEGTADLRPFDDVIGEGQTKVMAQQAETALPWQTVSEMHRGELIVADAEEASSKLTSLTSLEPPSQDPQIGGEGPQSQIDARVACRRIRSAPDQDLETLYSTMIRDWITSLPTSIPGRVRLAKDQLLRRVAAEVALASHIIRPEPVQPATEEPSQQSQQTWELPVRGGPSQLQTIITASQGQSSQQSLLPTPSPSATPSITTASSHPSTFTTPEISRLSTYTTFSKPPPPPLPRSLNNILSHWIIGTDPYTYDYRSASKHIAQREEEADEAQMTEKERARVRRRAERHIRRQRREEAERRAVEVASSQALEIMNSASASQPQLRVVQAERQPVGAESSQGLHALGGGVAASQVVPGRFGGRPPAKKKRKQGF